MKHPNVTVERVSLALSALWLLVAAASPTAHANAAPVLPSTVDELVELDEVLSRGRVTANIVAAAEDRVYRRYNKLNRIGRYDVHCGDTSTDGASRIMRRTCVPEFLRDYPGADARMSGTSTQCDGIKKSLMLDSPDDPFYLANCIRHQVEFGTFHRPQAVRAYPANISAAQLPAQERARFAQNVLQVMNSDAELRDMASGLAGLYAEMDRIQARYDRLRAERRAGSKPGSGTADTPGRHPGK